jgi:hypothetical protein
VCFSDDITTYQSSDVLRPRKYSHLLFCAQSVCTNSVFLPWCLGLRPVRLTHQCLGKAPTPLDVFLPPRWYFSFVSDCVLGHLRPDYLVAFSALTLGFMYSPQFNRFFPYLLMLHFPPLLLPLSCFADVIRSSIWRFLYSLCKGAMLSLR